MKDNSPEFDFFKNKITNALGLNTNLLLSNFQYTCLLKRSSGFTIVDDIYDPIYSVEGIVKYKLIIKKQKSYNGYTVLYNVNNSINNKLNLCNNATYLFADMKKAEFMEYIKKEFNAVAKNHSSVFFRTEEDAKRLVEWIDSLRLAYKMKEELA